MHACLIDLYYFLLHKTLVMTTSPSRTMSRSEEPAGYNILYYFFSRIKIPEYSLFCDTLFHRLVLFYWRRTSADHMHIAGHFKHVFQLTPLHENIHVFFPFTTMHVDLPEYGIDARFLLLKYDGSLFI
jgi:hypothetical protein